MLIHTIVGMLLKEMQMTQINMYMSHCQNAGHHNHSHTMQIVLIVLYKVFFMYLIYKNPEFQVPNLKSREAILSKQILKKNSLKVN